MKCLEHDPDYAPAWARIGRIYRVLGLYMIDQSAADNLARAEDAFARALELNPDLSLAHNLSTYLEVELGRARLSMTRLLARATIRSTDPELFAGLVQACRYRDYATRRSPRTLALDGSIPASARASRTHIS